MNKVKQYLILKKFSEEVCPTCGYFGCFSKSTGLKHTLDQFNGKYGFFLFRKRYLSILEEKKCPDFKTIKLKKGGKVK